MLLKVETFENEGTSFKCGRRKFFSKRYDIIGIPEAERGRFGWQKHTLKSLRCSVDF